jgi:hypothetical protein
VVPGEQPEVSSRELWSAHRCAAFADGGRRKKGQVSIPFAAAPVLLRSRVRVSRVARVLHWDFSGDLF